MQIKIKRIEDGKLPEYKTDGSAGADCYARIKNDIVIKPGASETIPLGFAVEIPVGYEMQIRGRSGLARKNNIDCFIGTIDSDYRGEVGAILINKGTDYFTVRPFDRIAQAVIAPVIKATWYLTENLSETERGTGGFGSTGVSEKKVEKFYEPFKYISEVETILGKKVIIDNKDCGVVKAAFYDKDNNVRVLFELENKECNMFLTTAFEHVKIDGHRFGKEIEFEEN